MSIARLAGFGVSLAFLVTTVGSALAGPPLGRGAPSAGRGHSSATRDIAKDEKDKDGSQAKDAAKDEKDKKNGAAKKDDEDKGVNEHSNKGGKLRGLDRADQVAGEHGKQGRAKARSKQGR